MRKHLLLSATLTLTFLTATISTSCSHQNIFVSESISREIANEVVAPMSVQELFTFKGSSNIKSGTNVIKLLKDETSEYKGIVFEMVEDAKMSNDEAFRLVPVIENQSYKIKVMYSKNAVNDLDAYQEVARFMKLMTQMKFTSQFSIFEVFFNASQNDFQSLQVLAKVRKAVFDQSMTINYSDDEEGFKQRSSEELKHWSQVNEKFDDVERVYNKKIKTQETARKAVMDALDKASDDEQFRALVAKNDRKGATELLRKYLPWEQMPPFEKMFWENHLKIMSEPVNLEDRIMIYRGIDDDIVQVAIDGGKELTREEAIRDQKMFLMSTMMTKNQGTWNRRLRSLTAMYEKFMGTDSSGSSEFTRASRITNMFVKHSIEPKGSPFLSFTPKFHVARSFGNTRTTAYFIDPRMIYFNYTSRYASEIEFLLPVVTFPDDLAAVWDVNLHSGKETQNFLKEQAMERLSREVGKEKAKATYDRIAANSEKYFKPVMGAPTGAVQTVQKPSGSFFGFFKKLLGMSTPKVEAEITEKSDMGCMDLIQLFWK